MKKTTPIYWIVAIACLIAIVIYFVSNKKQTDSQSTEKAPVTTPKKKESAKSAQIEESSPEGKLAIAMLRLKNRILNDAQATSAEKKKVLDRLNLECREITQKLEKSASGPFNKILK